MPIKAITIPITKTYGQYSVIIVVNNSTVVVIIELANVANVAVAVDIKI
jgi:hypothetical protein